MNRPEKIRELFEKARMTRKPDLSLFPLQKLPERFV